MTLEERTENFREKIANRFNTTDFQILEYTATRKPFKIKCLNCGKVSEFSRAENIFERKFLCSCKKPQYILKETGINLKKEFDEWYSKRGKKKYYILKNFTTVNNPITVKCKKCGSIHNRKVRELIKNDSCLNCERHIVVLKTDKLFKEQVFQKYDNEYKVLGEYKNNFEKIKIQHTCGKIFEVRPHDLLNREVLCPICDKSKGEKRIEKILTEYNIDFIPQYRLNDFKKAPYDFYLPNYNLLIEFQGRQHYEPVDKFGGEKQFYKQLDIDRRKKELAITQKYDLLLISYKEYNDIENILVQRLALEA